MILKKNIFTSTLFSVFHLLKAHQRKKVLLVLFLVLFNVFSEVFGLAALFPVLLMVVKNDIILTNPFLFSIYNTFGFSSKEQFLFVALALILVVFIVKNALSLLISYLQFKIIFNLATEFSILQFKTKFNAPFHQILEENSVVSTTNIASVPIQVMQNTLMSLVFIITEIIIAGLISLAIALYNFQVFLLIILTLVPVLYLIFSLTRKKSTENGKQHYQAQLNANIYLYESLRGFIDVKIFRKENYFLSKFITNQEKANKTHPVTNLLQLLTLRVLEVVIVLVLLLIVGYTFFIQHKGSESLLILLGLFVTAAYRIMPSANKIISSFMCIKQSQHLFDVLNGYDREQNTDLLFRKDVAENKVSFDKEIEFDGIQFSYSPNLPPALFNVSFTIKKNECVGIIGKSGSGKTTLINLLLRFYIEQKGQIKVDGKVLTLENVDGWRSLIGYVSQNIFIFDGTFQENIAFGVDAEDVDAERVKQCISFANLSALLQKMPEGLATRIGENGMKLSGGERQRIAIARAIYSGAKFFVFDEATSALDPETEKEITEAIYNLSKFNITMIIIAHRITTLNNCHVIYEMANGKIIKQYGYSELVNERIINVQ
jgi:ABC-type multidrug transport system fused ATPase/permease subunit